MNNIILANAINFILSSTQYGGTITFLDIDNTTFKTSTTMNVLDEKGNKIDELDPVSYNTYKLKQGHTIDYSNFRSTDKFIENAEPIETTVKEINKILNRQRHIHGIDKIVFVTARADMNDKDKFLKFFEEQLGLPMYDQSFVRIERVGNYHDLPIPQKKKRVFKKELDTGKYRNAIFIDDDETNLDNFLSLDNEYPDINFIALLVTQDLKLKRWY